MLPEPFIEINLLDNKQWDLIYLIYFHKRIFPNSKYVLLFVCNRGSLLTKRQDQAARKIMRFLRRCRHR